MRIAIDTDLGDNVDDALALALAAGLPGVVLTAVTTTWGETRLRAAMAARLLALLGLRPLLGAGDGHALDGRLPRTPLSALEAFEERPTPEGPFLAAEEALRRAGPLDALVGIGPLTNLARFIAAGLVPDGTRLVLMGGGIDPPRKEYNTSSDPDATGAVLDSGLSPTLLPLEVTLRCPLLPAERRAIAEGRKPAHRLLARMVKVWERQRPTMLHDPLAVAAAVRPEIVSTRPARLAIGEDGILREEPGPPNCRVAQDLDEEAFRRLFRGALGLD